MAPTYTPKTSAELCDIFKDAAANKTKISLYGGNSKSLIGHPTGTIETLCMQGFSGIVDYDPPELVLTVNAGTRLSEVQQLVQSKQQMLAFDPFDHGPLFGQPSGKTTIGGIIAAGIAGPARLSRGAARDHLLGFEAVSGRGDFFIGGAKVVKNVTGYDLPKLMAGSWGRLAALTQVTLKVLPRPEMSTTVIMRNQDADTSVASMALALGSSADVSAAAHITNWQGNGAITALRLDGIEESLKARHAVLTNLFGTNQLETLNDKESESLWVDVRYAKPLPETPPLWRIIIPPSTAPNFIQALTGLDFPFHWMMDWAGGLIWAATDTPSTVLRSAAKKAGGHAELIRAHPKMRTSTPVFHPQAEAMETLETRLRRSFDPAEIFETGRF